MIDLTPEYEDGKYQIKSDMKIVNRPKIHLGKAQVEKLQLARKIREKAIKQQAELVR